MKVCGLRTREEIDWAVDLGYNAVGFVLHKPSPRFRNAEEVTALARYAGDRIVTVAVGLDFDEVAPVYEAVDYVQVYRHVPVSRLIYAGTGHPGDKKYSYFMYDASRGGGDESVFPKWLRDLGTGLILSGGLRREGVARIIREHRPFGIDVSSGVESERGRKDLIKMKEFIEEARNAGE